jgi:hypothetical protein
MFILDVASNCNNYGIVGLFVIAKRIFNIIQILAPILAIIGLGINLVKSVIDPNRKNNFGMYKNWLIALIVVFAIPTLVNAVMGILGENYSISSCWNNAEQINKPGNSEYNDGIEGERPGAVNINPSDYE